MRRSRPITKRIVALDSLMVFVLRFFFRIVPLRIHPLIKSCVENLSVNFSRCHQLPHLLPLGNSHMLDLDFDLEIVTTPHS